MVESSHLDNSWPISHIVPGLPSNYISICSSPGDIHLGSGSGHSLSSTEWLWCPRSLSSPDTHCVSNSRRKPRVSQITVWCQQVLAFYKISSKFVDAGLNFTLCHSHPPISPLLRANGPHKNRGNIGVEIIISIYFVCDQQTQKCAVALSLSTLWASGN